MRFSKGVQRAWTALTATLGGRLYNHFGVFVCHSSPLAAPKTLLRKSCLSLYYTINSICTCRHAISFIHIFHCFHPPILSPAPLRKHIFTVHTLDCCVLFHVQISDQLAGGYCFLKLFTSVDTFLTLITLANDPIIHLPCIIHSYF